MRYLATIASIRPAKPDRRSWRGETLTPVFGGQAESHPLRGLAAGLLHHPVAERVDDAGPLGHGDELAGRDQAALGIAPAHERLDAHDRAVGRAADRLVVQLELAALDRPPQPRGQREALERIGGLGAVDRDAAAGGLRLVHRGVRVRSLCSGARTDMDDFFTHPERPLPPPPAFFQRTPARLAIAALAVVLSGIVGGLTDQGEDTPVESVAYLTLGLALLVPLVGTVVWALFYAFGCRRRWVQLACSYIYLGIVTAFFVIGSLLGL